MKICKLIEYLPCWNKAIAVFSVSEPALVGEGHGQELRVAGAGCECCRNALVSPALLSPALPASETLLAPLPG